MITKDSKNVTRSRIHDRIRKKMSGSQERPRLNIFRSVNHIYAQVIDDSKHATVVAASSLEIGKEKDGKKHLTGGNIAAAKQVGKSIAERAKAKGIDKVVFDRGGYLYHGRVKALAEAAREAGLQF
jgi:large subunit ribosomal protein L18